MLTIPAVASWAGRITHVVFAASIFYNLHNSKVTLPWNLPNS